MGFVSSKRFYLGVGVWTVTNALILLKKYADGSYDSMEGAAYTFVLGLLTIFIFFRPSKG